ncbi:MAG TPA: ATP synthase F1 subunit delta [Acidobacteriaceae bacterium]|jgi:F-type H+-transporting ATPase subunit delta|nr:ATP synthase F1 subunit delta [Acidobacteriaceae bacterium]
MAIVDLRYARALAAVIEERHLDLTDTQNQLNDFAGMLDESPELREVLHNPAIPEAQKLRLLDAIAQRAGLSGPIRNFVALLTRNQRLHELPEMITAFAALADQESGIAEVEITTARPLDPDNRRLLEQQVSKLAEGQRVHATYHEDPALLGGAVLRLGSRVYDGSVRAQLQQLKQRLVAAQL